VPLAWLAIVTLTAGYQKIFASDPALGFLAHADLLLRGAQSGVLPPGVPNAAAAARMALNDRLDAAVAAFFIAAVIVVLIASVRQWALVLTGRKPAVSTELPFSASVSPVAEG
jgi:carbon starvation protein